MIKRQRGCFFMKHGVVTRGNFRSRDKDGGQTIRSAVPENAILYVNITALCLIERDGNRSFTLRGIGIFDLFGSCDLDLNPLTFIYELDPQTIEICRMCKYELPMSRLSKVSV